MPQAGHDVGPVERPCHLHHHSAVSTFYKEKGHGKVDIFSITMWALI